MLPLEALLQRGIFICDKPPGPSSHEVTVWVKKILGCAKSGHAGTLDPQVSGVLPVGLNKSTRLLSYLALKEKTYVGVARFKEPLTQWQVQEIFNRFAGEITQTPPKISAVAKRPRRRMVYEFRLLEMQGDLALFRVRCEAGTYIRALIADINRHHTPAKLLELRRVAVANILEKEAHTLQELSDAAWLLKEKGDETALRKLILPVENFLSLPRVMVRNEAVEALCSGAQLFRPGVKSAEEGVEVEKPVALFSEGKEDKRNDFIGVGVAKLSAAEMQMPGPGLAVEIKRIALEKGKYEKKWKTYAAPTRKVGTNILGQ